MCCYLGPAGMGINMGYLEYTGALREMPENDSGDSIQCWVGTNWAIFKSRALTPVQSILPR